MTAPTMTAPTTTRSTVVLGETGKTGRRLAVEAVEHLAHTAHTATELRGDGIQRALGRPPKDFAQYAYETAATRIWTPTGNTP